MHFTAMLYTYHFDWRFQVAVCDQGCMFGRVDWREVVVAASFLAGSKA
jgi:hypothetical protein